MAKTPTPTPSPPPRPTPSPTPPPPSRPTSPEGERETRAESGGTEPPLEGGEPEPPLANEISDRMEKTGEEPEAAVVSFTDGQLPREAKMYDGLGGAYIIDEATGYKIPDPDDPVPLPPHQGL